MAVAVVLEFDDATLDQYDQVMEKMGLTEAESTVEGILFHWAARADNGLLVTDVWESREQFEKFAEEQIGPYTQEVGITSEPKISFYDVHNYLSA